MDEMDTRVAKIRKNIRENVIKYGQSIMAVAAETSEDELIDPSFTYTVGRAKTQGKAELIIFGVSAEVGHKILTNIYKMTEEGEKFPLNNPIPNVIEGYDVYFLPITKKKAVEYMSQTREYYEEMGGEWEAAQVVYPDEAGKWPWEEDVDPAMKPFFNVIGRTSIVTKAKK